MAAPPYVPATAKAPTSYQSPPRRPDSWTADRPGEVVGGQQPSGPALGNQGPDQGFALTLARRCEDRVVVAEGEHVADILAGCSAVALRRASLFGRAPVVHDVHHALELFGYLGEADSDLIEWRRPRFEEIAHHHHYRAARVLADSVPEHTLRATPEAVASARAENWRDPLGI